MRILSINYIKPSSWNNKVIMEMASAVLRGLDYTETTTSNPTRRYSKRIRNARASNSVDNEPEPELAVNIIADPSQVLTTPVDEEQASLVSAAVSNECSIVEVVQDSSLMSTEELEDTLSEFLIGIAPSSQSRAQTFGVNEFIRQCTPLFQQHVIDPFSVLLSNGQLNAGQMVHAMYEQANIATQFYNLLINANRVETWYPGMNIER